MNKVLIAMLLLISIVAASWNNPAFALEQKTRVVCVEQQDSKTKKIKQVCKTIKVHKKLEGTPVPPKTAK